MAFQHIALIGKYQGASAAHAQSLLGLLEFLSSFALKVSIEQETAAQIRALLGETALHQQIASLNLEGIGQHCDVAVVVGGDGTMLGVGRQLAPLQVPMIGINHGRLGFMTDIALPEYEKLLPEMLRGAYERETRALIHAKVLRGSDCVMDALALNDVVVNRGASSGMVELRIEIDGRFVSNQRADGLIVATPTGSTAYALSAGGPIMHPDLRGWVMVPIAPHTLSNRPLTIADTAEIAIELVAGRQASAHFDMQSLTSLLPGDRVLVRRSEHSACFLHPRDWSYYDTLRRKLHWNEGNV